MIDVGLDKGVKQGMTFKVLRNDGVIGEVKAIQIRKDISACDIIQANTALKPGDSVKF